MRFTLVILTALLCLNVYAETAVDEKDSDEAIMAAAEKLVSEGKTLKTEDVAATEAAAVPAAATAAPTTAGTTKPESEIPVFTKSEKLTKSEGSLMWRMIGSLALVAVVGGAMLYATRRWSTKRNKGGEKARIEMLHQYHMGPRKTLALIRVAGEVMLIGCTDHNINMLKPVTLIDDELEGIMKQDFNGFLEDDFQIENVRAALRREKNNEV